MITERRFLTGFRSADADTPGLVQEDDGTVWLVAPDGTRTQISGGGSSALLWASYWSLAHAEITTGVNTVVGWEPSGYGVGSLDSVTIEDTGDGPGTHVSFADVGCYMVSLVFGGIWTLADGVDPAQLLVEVQVDNSEQDPWLILPVIDPTGSPGALGTLCAVINIYEDHDPVYHGFEVILRPRNVSVTPFGQAATMKIVKLA